jgi:hypothetical protein
MEQKKNSFKELIDSRKGKPAELKKECAVALGLNWQKVNRMYNGDSDLSLTPDKLVLLLTWANEKKVDGAPDWTLNNLVPDAIVVMD